MQFGSIVTLWTADHFVSFHMSVFTNAIMTNVYLNLCFLYVNITQAWFTVQLKQPRQKMLNSENAAVTVSCLLLVEHLFSAAFRNSSRESFWTD